MNMNNLFWNEKSVCVTGGAGFLGAAIVNKLLERGCTDVAIPRRSEYDLRILDAVQQLYAEAQPDIVIHLAANVGGIGANSARPAEFFYDNLMMGVQLMHEAWRSGVKKFVAVGTVCAYPKFTRVPFCEDDLWDGYPEETNAPYGLAKKMMLVQSQSYRKQYGFNSIFLMPANIYGPGDNFAPETSHVIPALIRKCSDARNNGSDQVVVWGDGSPTREFIYVDDAAEGVLLAGEHYDSIEPVNIGSGIDISIKELAEKIVQLTGFEGDLIWDSTKPNGQPVRRLDVSRALEQFGFRARTGFNEGLSRTVDWYLAREDLLTS